MAAATTFWARRKAAVQAEAEAETQAAIAAAQAADAKARDDAQAEMTEAELLESLGLPDPDSLTKGDDFSAFMARAVPEHLRRRALRKLWVSNPVLANLDGLVDHGEDYTDAATVMPDMKTAYQVGKGMMQHVLALAEQAEAEQAEVAQTADDLPAEPAPEVETVEELTIDVTPDAAPEPVAEASSDAETPRPRRHMRFEFAS
jgi:hypothetical protein